MKEPELEETSKATPNTPTLYGVAGKGVKVPWYLSRPSTGNNAEDGDGQCAINGKQAESSRKSFGKKTMVELGRRGRREREVGERKGTGSLVGEEE